MTISQFRKRALVSPLNLSSNTVGAVVCNYEALRQKLAQLDGNAQLSPEIDAIDFYARNHVVSVLCSTRAPNEDLGAASWILTDYCSVVSYKALRMYYYLLLICTREARHLKNPASMVTKVKSAFGDEVGYFINRICGQSEDGAISSLLKAPPDCTLGQYVGALDYIYDYGSWSNKYGGKAWGRITKVLGQFVRGEISAEIMLDTSFSLSHNCGSIFNKGMLFNQYSSSLRIILDVQRSGQIPSLILEGATNTTQFITPSTRQFLARASETLGDFFSPLGYVDWFLVEKAGSLSKYPGYKKTQVALYGAPAGMEDGYPSEDKVTPAAAPPPVSHYYEYLPGKFLQKHVR